MTKTRPSDRCVFCDDWTRVMGRGYCEHLMQHRRANADACVWFFDILTGRKGASRERAETEHQPAKAS